MSIRRFALAVLALLVCACATAPRRDAAGTPPRPPRNTVTYEQLASTQLPTLYEAVQRLQPSWLRPPRGNPTRTEIGVFLNGARVGGLEFLREFPARQAQEVRYVPFNEVEAEIAGFQNERLGAAILITGRRPQ